MFGTTRKSDMPSSSTISTRRSSPITRLNADILLYIFSLNADMYLKQETRVPALWTLQHSSQVCGYWRHLAIGSSSLWARVLNLNVLPSKGNWWMKEILRRTGTALLHIKAVRFLGGMRLTSRLEEYSVQWVLTEHWTRIRSLDLDLDRGFTPDKQPWRQLFQRPAPVLEVFQLSWPHASNFLDENFFLFSGRSPLLRTLCVADMTLHFATLSAPNLRNLDVGSHCSFVYDKDNQPSLLRAVTLSQLTAVKLDIRSSVNIALAFLAHVTPADGCTLEFSGHYNDETPDRDSEKFYRKILSTYSESCAELSTATSLEAAFSEGSISFSVNLPSHRQFAFQIGIDTLILPNETISALLSSLTTIAFEVMQLRNVTELGLYLEDCDEICMNIDVTKLIHTFISVEELATNHETITILEQKIQRNPALIPFPALKILIVSIFYPHELLQVADFINGRVKLGFSADKLVVNVFCSSDRTLDLNPLRDLVPGLTVIGRHHHRLAT